LQLGAAAVDNQAGVLQKHQHQHQHQHQHDAAAHPAAEHSQADSMRAQPEFSVQTASNTLAETPRAPLQLQGAQQQPVSQPPAMSLLPAARSPRASQPPESPHHQPATPALFSHIQVPSPSKPSAEHYDAASSIAAHVLAAKQLAGSGSSAVVDKRDFARSVA
jgi:hypothetical protein